MKHTINGVLVWEKNVWKDEPQITFFQCSAENAPGSSEYCNRAVIREHSFEVEVADDFDPTADVIAELTEMKRKLRLKLAEELAELDDRISKLQALPMPAEVA
jgi:hypothetical protein